MVVTIKRRGLGNMARPYSVVTPSFDLTSGGIRVMYGLHGWLLAKGQVSFINGDYENKDCIAVYPEIVHGNPVGAKTVVRYILNKPGVMATGGIPGPTRFDKNDLIYVFSEIFNTMGVDNSHKMFLPILDLHIFKDTKKKRLNKCYFVGKGINTLKHPKEAIEINRQVAADQNKLAELLNTCEVMYSYDPVSAMFEIARLCGCRVVIIPQGHYKKEQFQKYEPGMNGISWGLEEEKKLNVKEFRLRYQEMWFEFSKKMDLFIEETQTCKR